MHAHPHKTYTHTHTHTGTHKHTHTNIKVKLAQMHAQMHAHAHPHTNTHKCLSEQNTIRCTCTYITTDKRKQQTAQTYLPTNACTYSHHLFIYSRSGPSIPYWDFPSETASEKVTFAVELPCNSGGRHPPSDPAVTACNRVGSAPLLNLNSLAHRRIVKQHELKDQKSLGKGAEA